MKMIWVLVIVLNGFGRGEITFHEFYDEGACIQARFTVADLALRVNQGTSHTITVEAKCINVPALSN